MRFAHFDFDPATDRLGEGPLSEVYRAVDTKLGRTVALKILRQHAEIDPQADQRFHREAKHTSKLDHPHIATIFEYDRFEGTSYIAMEYLEGRTLDKIIKDQSLGYEECLRVALQLCAALEVVHLGQLIHRDLKPANILLKDDGNLKLLDFGIARAADEASITQHGMLVGTVLYMSPEQVRGDELDARSDIFSLGSVLYHVMTRALPYPGDSFPEVCMAILDGPPRKRPSEVRSGFPPPLEEFLMRCLRGAPEDRYADASEALQDLRRVEGDMTGTGRLRPIALSGRLLLNPIACGGADPSSCSVMAGGLRKDLAAALARNKNLHIDFEREDGAAYDFLLDATLSVENKVGRLEIMTTTSRDGRRIVHKDRVTSKDDDEWAMQEDLVRAGMRVLRARLMQASQMPAIRSSRKADDARRLVTRAREVLHRGRSKHVISATSLLRQALERDRFSANAYAVLGEAMVRKYLLWDGDPTFLEEARENADKALTLDSNCALAHTALGFANHLSGHLDDAQREYRLAMQCDQEEWFAHRLLGSIYAREGNFKSATGLFQKAIGLKPTHIASYDHLYGVLVRLDRYEEALETADSGIAAGRKHLKRVPDDIDGRLHTAMLYARLGRSDEARNEINAALEIAPRDGFTCFHAACVHAIIEEPEDLGRAIDLLTSARDRGYYMRGELTRNTDLDVLRSLPEFGELQVL
ncbi:Serine/threonine-protein kinase StkP [Planctomycetes bacterium Poly30]|uniref:Serine/threonine-protein kinase StkP n=1 Tax=Saltatorellus ferox TaxID=2528018 RepID=A0A518ENI8_9BACT|nr:Serine/threonine-protein kinase StkP [Planctomycetes bacterium Poly30]